MAVAPVPCDHRATEAGQRALSHDFRTKSTSLKNRRFLVAEIRCIMISMIYGMHVSQLTARAYRPRWLNSGQRAQTLVFREVASGARTDRAQLRRALGRLQAGDVLMVSRLDRLARSTRDLLNTIATITSRKAGFRSLGDAWADTTSPHGRLMLTVLGGLADSSAS